MERFFKMLAVLVIIAHIAGAAIYAGVIPRSLFSSFSLSDAGRIMEKFTGGQETEKAPEPDPEETAREEETPAREEAGAEEDARALEEELNAVRIELSETLPPLTEEDLYDLTEVLRDAGALRATDGHGTDWSDRILCELSPDLEEPGHFTASFSLRMEDGRIEEGPAADLRVDLNAPFLLLRENDVTIQAGTDYDPYSNVVLCMDLDGTVLTDFVAQDNYYSTVQAGDYELRFYIYSRINPSSASRTMQLHVTN